MHCIISTFCIIIQFVCTLAYTCGDNLLISKLIYFFHLSTSLSLLISFNKMDSKIIEFKYKLDRGKLVYD
jgi:hypothetical protein